jgi:3-methyladenine DNA glycosylase Mpg
MVGIRLMRRRQVMFGDPGTAAASLIEGGGWYLNKSAAAGGRSGAVVAAREVDRFGRLMVGIRWMRRRRVMFGDPGTAASLVEGGGWNVEGAAAQCCSGAVVAAREEDHFAYRVLLLV